MLQVVIPMAGDGARFARAGHPVLKPLIDVDGKPMFVHSVESLPLEITTKLIFVCRSAHLRDHGLRDAIERHFGRRAPIVVELEDATRGQACTVLEARLALEPDAPLLIHNADTAFRSDLGTHILESRADGIVTVFEDDDPKWSFARIETKGDISEVAEKKPISSWATVGAYFFRRAGDFIEHASAMIERGEVASGEYYVGPVFNRLISSGGSVIPDYATEVRCMGTPEDLAACSSS